jgi:polysaccharide pyruvyl transferase WcaK-like protein
MVNYKRWALAAALMIAGYTTAGIGRANAAELNVSGDNSGQPLSTAKQDNKLPQQSLNNNQSGTDNNNKKVNKMKKIVLRSSWQTVNIGDISHSPGMMEILTKNLPDVQITLWPYHVENGVEEMLNKYYPQVKIVKGERYSPQIDQLFAESDFFLHGSGPMVAVDDIIYWRSKTNKPYGFGGITIESVSSQLREILDGAQFFFARDSITEKLIKSSNIQCPLIEFGPDAAFAMVKSNDETNKTFMTEHALEPGKFLCVVSRIRYTPYHLIKPEIKLEGLTLERYKCSLQHQDTDLAPLIGLIKKYIAYTGEKVVLCPEMSYEMELNYKEIYSKLTPAEQQKTICMKNYWLPDQAVALYKKSRCLVSMEMHSPILSLAQLIPSFYLQLPTDTCKGEMWHDIGLSEWIHKVPEKSADDIWPYLKAVIDNPAESKAKAAKAMTLVNERQRQIATAIDNILNRRAVAPCKTNGGRK